MELRRRYAEVYVGNLRNYEVDFVAVNNSEPAYYQVTLNCSDAKTLERETRPLLAIEDNYPKIIISLEKIFGADCKGIRLLSLQDFLLNPAE